MAEKAHRHVVAASEAGRIDRLVMQLTGLSRAQVRRIVGHGGICVNGDKCSEDFRRVAAGDLVTVAYDPHNIPRGDVVKWRDAAFRIVFEDEHLIVVDKAAGVLTVPTGPAAHEGKTLVARVGDYLRKTSRGREAIAVHRLDQGTSGLLVLAKTQAAAQRLRAQFASRKPERIYHALVAGIVAVDQGTFRSRLITAPNLDQVSTRRGDRGQLAITHYRVVGRHGDYTHVQCRLETGRRNQIRVHFSDAGHPVLGDPRYQAMRARHPRWRARGRLALHAATLGLTHPMTGESMRFESPLPREFVRMVGAQP